MIAGSTSRPRRLAEAVAAAALLALYYLMASSAASQKSMTFDEMAHLTAGYTYWVFDDYRLHPENGNWPQRLGALPAVLAGAAFPSLNQQDWTTSNVYAMGDRFLYSSGNDAGTLLRRGRLLVALLGVALGALIYAWARRLVSPSGAWVSLVLFVFSPTLLAHGPLVTSDVAAALFFTAAAGAMWTAMHRVTPATILGGAVFVAGAFLSKFSAPILAVVATVMLTVRLIDSRPLVVGLRRPLAEWTGRGRQLAVLAAVLAAFALVTWALIWASFGFRYSAFAAATTGHDAFLGALRDEPGIVGRFLSVARQHHLLPEAYIYGFGHTLQYASERAAFLDGRFGTTGWWWYFPYAFAVKTTIPGMILGLLALAALMARWKNRPADQASAMTRQRVWTSLYAGTPLLALVAVYWVFALATNLNIGHRHLLPTYPALCILAGAAALWIRPVFEPVREPVPPRGRERRRQRSETRRRSAQTGWTMAAAIGTTGLLAWHVVESVSIRPHYLAYFNQLVGGPANGYKRLADSSLDWGQDLPALKQWLDEQRLPPDGSGVYLSYFGTARPEYYGIRATPLAGFIDRRPPEPPARLGGGVYCVSATVLNVIGRLFYRPAYESNYQAALAELARFARASETEQDWLALMRQTGEAYWRQLFVQFDQLRTGRLMAFLRGREPDATVGYSILIYRLTESDVHLALNGPPPGR